MTTNDAIQGRSPTALVAIYHDRSGKVLGSTVTSAKRGLTAAVFRAALRSLPSRAKAVTFAASGNMTAGVRDGHDRYDRCDRACDFVPETVRAILVAEAVFA